MKRVENTDTIDQELSAMSGPTFWAKMITMPSTQSVITLKAALLEYEDLRHGNINDKLTGRNSANQREQSEWC